MPGRVGDNEVDIEVGEVDGVPVLAVVSVALTAEQLKPAVDDMVDAGAESLIVDLSGVGDTDPDVLDYLALQRTYMVENGGEMALVGAPTDERTVARAGFLDAIPTFDGIDNAVTFVRGASA